MGAKLEKKRQKYAKKPSKNEHIILHTLLEKPKTVLRNAEISANIVHGLRTMPKLFVFNYALLCFNMQKNNESCTKTPKMCCCLVK